MRIDHFLLYTTLGAGVWNSVLAFIGYLIYRAMPDVGPERVVEEATKYSHEIGYVILALAVVIIGVLVYKGVQKKKTV